MASSVPIVSEENGLPKNADDSPSTETAVGSREAALTTTTTTTTKTSTSHNVSRISKYRFVIVLCASVSSLLYIFLFPVSTAEQPWSLSSATPKYGGFPSPLKDQQNQQGGIDTFNERLDKIVESHLSKETMLNREQQQVVEQAKLKTNDHVYINHSLEDMKNAEELGFLPPLNDVFLKTSGGNPDTNNNINPVLDRNQEVRDIEEAARAAQAALSTVGQPLQPKYSTVQLSQLNHPEANPDADHVNIAENAKIIDETTGLPLPFPVYETPDDHVPGREADKHGAAASEQLECGVNVLQFVVDATDVKDECEGMRRAFDAHCARIGETADAGYQRAPVRRTLQPMKEQLQRNPNDAFSYNNFLAQLEAEELKTCCSSIMNVFHDLCDRSESEELDDSRLFVIVSMIAVCLLVKTLIKNFKIRWLPEAAGCILVGAIGGLIFDLFSTTQARLSFDEVFFLRVMLPPIVFEAALNIDKKAFFRHAIPISLYACIGTIFSTFVTAFIVHQGTSLLSPYFCTAIPFVESLSFGALISSIDPVAVLSVLSNMGIANTDTIYVLVFGESLLNDGVAIVLFDTLVHFLDDNLVIDSEAVVDASVHFFVVAVGSVSVGVLCGACCTAYFWAMHGCHSPLVEVLTFFCWALIPFYVCDGIGWSGIVSLVSAGFLMDLFVIGSEHSRKSHHNSHEILGLDDTMSSPLSSGNFNIPSNLMNRKIFRNSQGHLSHMARNHVHFVTEINSTLMETAIFAYLGLFLFSSRYHWNFFHSLIAIFACLLSRAAMVPLMSGAANRWMKHRMDAHRKKQKGSFDASEVENGLDDDELSVSDQLLVVDHRLQIVLWFSGLRGAMSFALVENIPLFDAATGHGSKFKSELKAMTSASIVFTVFVLGGATYYLMEYLGMSAITTEEELEMMSPLTKSVNDLDRIPGESNGNGVSVRHRTKGKEGI